LNRKAVKKKKQIDSQDLGKKSRIFERTVGCISGQVIVESGSTYGVVQSLASIPPQILTLSLKIMSLQIASLLIATDSV